MNVPGPNVPSAARAGTAKPAQAEPRAGSASPEEPAAPFDPERPWISRSRTPGPSRWRLPPSLLPLLRPPDPWPLAQACGLLEGEDRSRLREALASERGRTDHAQEVRALLDSHVHARLSPAWKSLTRALRSMPQPELEPALWRLLPPPARELLEAAWQDYRVSLLETLWEETPEDPRQDWRVRTIHPPFPVPPPAPVPPLPVEPGPDLWMAWASPTLGALEPILLQGVGAPRATESPEIRHTASGVLAVPTLVGTPICLDQTSADPLIRALHHVGGLWVDETPAAAS